MARALKNESPEQTYLEFFELTRPPFARLSLPSELFQTKQYTLLMDHLGNAAEESDSMVVVRGADGSGKTTLLNSYIAGLSDDNYFATIDDSCTDEQQFYCAFLRQLGFSDIVGTPQELRRITKEFLVHRGKAGVPVLMIFDNAHLINPLIIDQLRSISAIKVKSRRVVSVVLAGNANLGRIMESPVMNQMKFNSSVTFNIRVYTQDETASYILHRLNSAGDGKSLKFPKDIHPLIYGYTGGIPNRINMLCNEVLIEAHAQESRVITEEIVRTVADNRRLLPNAAPPRGKGRRSTDIATVQAQPEERILARKTVARDSVGKSRPKADMPDGDGKHLMATIAELSEQVGELKADRTRAIQDIDSRDKDIRALRKKLDAQFAESEKVASALGDNSHEIVRLSKALSNNKESWKKSEESAVKLAADLEKERRAAEDAQIGVDNANATIEELTQRKSELQVAVSELTADLKVADELVDEIDGLEKKTATLENEVEKKTVELRELRSKLDAKDDALSDSEKLLQDTRSECKSLRGRVDFLTDLEASITEKEGHIAELQAELAEYSQEVKALEALNGEAESRAVDQKHLGESGSDSESQQDQGEVVKELEESVAEKVEHIDELEAELARASEAIKALEDKNEEIESDAADEKPLQEKSADSDTQQHENGVLKELEESVAERDEHIEELEAEVAQYSEDIKALEDKHEEIESRAADDKLPQETQAESDQQHEDEDLKELEETVAEKDAQIAALLAELDQFSKKKKAKQEKDEEVESRAGDAAEEEEDSSTEPEKAAGKDPGLTGSQSGLTENTQFNLPSTSVRRQSRKSGNQLVSRPKSSRKKSTGKQNGVVIAAFDVLKAGKVEHVLEISKGTSRIMIGRAEDSELCLDSAFVSRHHALLFCTEKGIHIEDLKSFNGTIVNAKKTNRHELRSGDVVSIGDFELRPRED